MNASLDLVVLHVPDCPNLPPMLARLAEVTTVPVRTREITTDAEAVAAGMRGSPTLLVNGRDPFAGTEPCSCGLACRLYRDEQGRLVAVPSADQLRAALVPGRDPGEMLAEFRARALPSDPAQRSVLRAILRSFATTGGAPALATLEPLVAGGREALDQVLVRLHEQDVIRIDAAGEVAVAYPFSAAPTRHQVRIGGDSDDSAVEMCAIDALGIAAMVDRATRIESIDVTIGTPITVTMPAGRSDPGPAHWIPADAVVFVGATSGGGPSAQCCCDYLNFFADHAAAIAWTREHPQVPGQILDPRQAEDLAVRLFGHLLHDDDH
jgi:Alkylmercury lyase